MNKKKSSSSKDKWLKLMTFALLGSTFILLNLYCFKMFIDADTLFPYRYVSALQTDNPSLLIVQPGSRVFPEWLYAWIVMKFTVQIEPWSHLMLLINCSLLTLGLWYFLKQIKLHDSNQVTYLLVIVLAAIPVLSLLHNNYLHYYIFMHGTHAFLLPFVFFGFGYLINTINQPQTSRVIGVFLLLVLSLLVASNQLIILLLIGPLICVLLWLWLTGFDHKQIILNLILYLLISVVLGVFMAFCFQQLFPSILFMHNEYSVFDQGLWHWFTENRTLRHLLDRHRSGYIFEIMLAAVGAACFALFYFRKKPHEPFYLVMLFYLVSFLSFFVVTWVTNKNHIRYMPHLLFFSPLIILLVLQKFKLLKSFAFPAMFGAAILLLLVVIDAEPSLYEKKRFKVGLSDINVELINAKKQFALNGDGLSDYWFSHSHMNESFQVLPITKGLQQDKIKAVTWAINLNEYWVHEKYLKSPRIFNFVINYKFSDKPKWAINEHVMLHSFGAYDQVVKFTKGIYDYQVYIYSDGVQTEAFYADLEQHLIAIKQKN